MEMIRVKKNRMAKDVEVRKPRWYKQINCSI